jgi:hypothetical protein
MGMRKKWSRSITVDGVRYRYHVAEDHFDGSGLNICIQQVDPAGQRLLSRFRKPMTWAEVRPGHTVGRVQPHAVTPRIIRELILAGLVGGWRPAETGLATFHLSGPNVVPQLPKPV